MSRIPRRAAKRAATGKPGPKAGLSLVVHSAKDWANRNGAWGLSSRSDYQRTICQLELELSLLRNELDDARGKIAVLESDRRYYRFHFERMPVGLIMLDEIGRLLDFNDTFSELAGLATSNRGELFFGRFLAPGYGPRFQQHLLQAQHADGSVSCQLSLRLGDSNLPVQLISRAIRDESGAQARSVRTVIVDISRRVRQEEARAKEQSDFKAVVDTIPGLVWECDPETLKLTYVSPRAGQILGYENKDWYSGQTWEALVYSEDRERVAAAMRKLATDRQDAVLEYRMFRADRTLAWVSNSLSAAVVGRQLRLFGVVLDITDRKNAEEQLRHAREELEQRVQERTAELRTSIADLEAFSYSLSHDLRAPLRAMQGYAQLLLSRFGTSLDETGRSYFRRLMASTERLDHLIQDVLRYSQISRAPVELKKVNLEKLLDEVINDYPTLLPTRVRIEVQKPLLPVRGHEAFLTQCMSNLLSNAAKFNRAGETPRVRVSTQELKRGKVRVWFEDNGIGIAPEDQRRIFGMFERVHSNKDYEGTGIGLTIVAKAVERMGGHVGVESAVGHGSRFWLELPGATS